MNHIAEVIELIANGIDPTTGEVFDTELLRGDPEIETSIRKISKAFRAPKSNSKYIKYEHEYPNYIVIMKEGFFYAAHNASAAVMGRELNYKTVEDLFGRISTGGPDIEKICDVFSSRGYSYIVVEGNNIVRKNDGRNPFADNTEKLIDSSCLSENSNDEQNQAAIYPYNLIIAIENYNQSEVENLQQTLPKNICDRIDEVFHTFPDRIQRMLYMRYAEGKTLQIIAEEFDLSRERIRQLLEKYIKRMRSKRILPFLLGEISDLDVKKNTARKEEIQVTAEKIGAVVFPDEAPIPISDVAMRINSSGYGRKITYLDISHWLASIGLVQEGSSEEDTMKRRPTEKGRTIGITVENRVNSTGKEYQVMLFNSEAQLFIKAHLDELINTSVAKMKE